VAKPGLTPRKAMFCVCMCRMCACVCVCVRAWWDWKGIVHCKLLPGQTIDSNLYCQQLERLRQAIERKWPELINRKSVVFHHDKIHTSSATRQKLRELDWEDWILMHLIVLTLHHQTTICFALYRVLSNYVHRRHCVTQCPLVWKRVYHVSHLH